MILLLASLAALAAPEPVVDRMALVLVRVLAYDASLEPSGPLKIGVFPASSADGVAVITTLNGLAGVTVAGRPIGAPRALAGDDLPRELAGLDAVVVCTGADEQLAALAVAARAAHVPLLTVRAEYVGRGAALGVRADGPRLTLLVDLGEAVAQGSAFSADMLQLAERVDR